MLVVFAVALTIRILYLIDASNAPFFRVPIFDAQNYDLLARKVARDGMNQTDLFWQPSLYPLVLSIIYRCTGSSIGAAQAIQCVLSSLLCALTYRLGSRLGGHRVGWIAGIVLALYGPLIYYDTQLLANVWAELWAIVLVSLLISERVRSIWGWALLGALGGLAALTRPTFMPFLFATGVWLLWKQYRSGLLLRPLVLGALTACAAFGIAVLPVAIACKVATDRLTILPASSGLNFYLGNNVHAREMEAMRGWEVVHLRAKAQREAGDDIWKENAYFSREATTYLRTQPKDALLHWFRKLAAFTTPREIPSYEDLYFERNHSFVLAASVWRWGGFGFPFGVLLPCAIIGVFVAWKRLPAPFVLLILLDALSISMAHVVGRTRTTIIPLLTIAAALGCAWARERIRSREYPQLASALGCAIAMAILFAMPGPFGLETFPTEAESYLSAGFYAQVMGKTDLARQRYERALELDPDNPSAHFNLGVVMAGCQHHEEALRHYDASLLHLPTVPEIQFNRGNALIALARAGEAIEAYQATLQLDPGNADARYNLAYLLTDLQKPDEAIQQYEEILRRRPSHLPSLMNLGLLYEQRSRPEDAARCYRRALSIQPSLEQARQRLSRVTVDLKR